MTLEPLANAAPVILCVEDEADLRRDLVEELQEAGYMVLEAGTGEEALRWLTDSPPDLVLCDISIPGPDGYAVLQSLREQHSDQADIPFVFLSALGDPRKIVAGKRSGADDYLVKPVDFDLMLATVEARLRQVARIRAGTRNELERVRAAFQALAEANASAGTRGAEQALDLVATGLVLLDRRANVCLANRRARQIAAQTEALQIGETVRCRSSRHQSALRTMIESVIGLALEGKEATASHALPRSHDQRDLMVVASAMPTSAGSEPENAVVALFISDPEGGPVVSAALLSSLFGLTPTEARIAQGLSGGKRPSAIAGELGVAQTTVAFHMRNLFQKTGTSRQAELVALILASPAPLAEVGVAR